MYVSGSVRDGVLHLALAGDWRARDVPAIEAELAGLSWQGIASIELDPSGLGALDLSGAWLLHDFGQRAARSGAVVSYPGGVPEPVRLVDRTLQDAAGAGAGAAATAGEGALAGRVSALGQTVVDRLRGGRRALEFVGRQLERLGADPRRGDLALVHLALDLDLLPHGDAAIHARDALDVEVMHLRAAGPTLLGRRVVASAPHDATGLPYAATSATAGC